MYDYDPNYYVADGVQNNNRLAMAPPHEFNDYGPKRPPKPPISSYGPNHPVCPCYHPHGDAEKLPPIKRPEHPEDYYINPPFIPSPEECKCQIKDRFPISNIINVESQLLITLKVTLYGTTEEDDKTVILENGKKYKITFVTEYGVKQVTGILRHIDSNIPTKCIRYIGESNEVTDFAYIIVDGSSAGNSNIVKIFIRSLRGIEEIKEEAPDSESNSDSESSSNSDSESSSESTSDSESTTGSESESTSEGSSSESTSEDTSESESTTGSESGSETPSEGSESSSESTSNSESSATGSESDSASEGSNSESTSEDTSESETEIKSDTTTDPTPDTETTMPDYSNTKGDANA